MSNVRSYLESRYHHLYRHEEPYGPDTCTYCGDPATTRDHVIPLSYLASLGDFLQERLPLLRMNLMVVPCCTSCNVIAGRTMFRTIAQKRIEIQKRIRRKHARLLGSYDWQDEDLDEMGPTMRQYIRQQENKRTWLLARLAWPRRAHVTVFNYDR